MNTKNNTFPVDISPEMIVYKILQKQEFGVNVALAEFIDNSIQSFQDEKVKLNSTNITEPQITISINSKEKTIAIKDNAAGISRNDFRRAMKPGVNYSDFHASESLSVYGIGMKVAAVWLSDTWKLETSHVSSDEIISIDFDLNNLLHKDKKQVNAAVIAGNLNDHYTRITITNCTRSITEKDCRLEILPYLLETFERFKDIKIVLFFDNEEIIADAKRLFPSHNKLKTMIAKPFIKLKIYDDKAADITWEKKISFNLGSKKIKGFIKLIEPGGYRQPGIRLLRNNRVIVGTGAYPNRPPIISDTTDKYGQQRIYGELHLDGFTVNYKKNGFDDDLKEMYKQILEIITEPPDLIAQSRNFRKEAIPNSANQKSRLHDKEGLSTKPPSDELSPKGEPTFKNRIKESTAIINRLGKLEDTKLLDLYTSMCGISTNNHPLLCNLGAWCFWEILLWEIKEKKQNKDREPLRELIAELTGKKIHANAQAERIVEINSKGNLIKHDSTYSTDALYLIKNFNYLKPVIIAFLDAIIEKESNDSKQK